METERYMQIRSELIKLHSILTEWTFNVIMPASQFITLKRLSEIEKNPPINGFESLEIPQERPMSISRILDAFVIMGDEAQVYFRSPRRDIPVIYETIQETVRLWCEIKSELSYLRTPPLEELELLEKFSKYLFGDYANYYHEKINNSMQIKHTSEMTLLDMIKGRMMYGDAFDEPISYISYVDQYKSTQGYAEHSAVSYGSGFGGGGL